MKSLLISVLCVCALAYGADPRLYGIITGFPANYLEVYTIAISPNGSWSTVVNNFAYLTDESETYDGISGFDFDQKVLYYSTDTDSSFIFRAGVKTDCLRPPISVNAKEIMGMKYDSMKKRMIITYLDATNSLNIMGYSTQGGAYTVLSVLNQYKQDWLDTAIDSANQLYYFVGANQSGIWVGHLSIATTNAPISVKYPLNFGMTGLYPEFVSWDPVRKLLVGAVSSFAPSLHYYYFTVDPSNWKTTIKPIKAEFGIATCFAYHPVAHTLYIGWAPNGPGKLYTVDILSGDAVGIVLHPLTVLSDIAADHMV